MPRRPPTPPPPPDDRADAEPTGTDHAGTEQAALAAIFEATVDAVITIDERGTVERFNSAAERIFGYTRDEVIGKNIEVLMPEPYHSEHDGYLQAYRETGRRRIIGIGREVVGKRKDGSTFPMDLAVSEVYLPDGRRIFVGLVRDISERRALEHQLLRVAEEERRRIGQDLHDGLGQMLTGTGLLARGLARLLEAEGSEYAGDAAELMDFLAEADAYARSLARGLVPVEMEARGLEDALARLADQAGRLFGVSCRFESVGEGGAEEPDGTTAAHLFRIAQEAVSNAISHGHARHVAVALASSPQQIRLRIEDDGVGFPAFLRAGGADAVSGEPMPAAPRDAEGIHAVPDLMPGRAASSDRGMGVRIMHYRARVIGGTLEIRPGPEGGTIVTCTLPAARYRPTTP